MAFRLAPSAAARAIACMRGMRALLGANRATTSTSAAISSTFGYTTPGPKLLLWTQSASPVGAVRETSPATSTPRTETRARRWKLATDPPPTMPTRIAITCSSRQSQDNSVSRTSPGVLGPRTRPGHPAPGPFIRGKPLRSAPRLVPPARSAASGHPAQPLNWCSRSDRSRPGPCCAGCRRRKCGPLGRAGRVLRDPQPNSKHMRGE